MNKTYKQTIDQTLGNLTLLIKILMEIQIKDQKVVKVTKALEIVQEISMGFNK